MAALPTRLKFHVDPAGTGAPPEADVHPGQAISCNESVDSATTRHSDSITAQVEVNAADVAPGISHFSTAVDVTKLHLGANGPIPFSTDCYLGNACAWGGSMETGNEWYAYMHVSDAAPDADAMDHSGVDYEHLLQDYLLSLSFRGSLTSYAG